VAAELTVLGVTLYLTAYMASTIAVRLRTRVRETVVLSRAVAAQAAELDAAYRKLQTVESAKSQYMRKVSHELRGPLGTIQTALKVALQRSAAAVDPESRDLLERAERRAGELAEVTGDLLALSRAREGRLAVERSEVDLVAVVREQLDEAMADAERAGVTVTGEASAASAVVRGDPRDLGQLCRNLLSNAIRYTAPGGRVTVRLDREGDRIRLQVEDTGIGIPEAELPRVFEEFYRAAMLATASRPAPASAWPSSAAWPSSTEGQSRWRARPAAGPAHRRAPGCGRSGGRRGGVEPVNKEPLRREGFAELAVAAPATSVASAATATAAAATAATGRVRSWATLTLMDGRRARCRSGRQSPGRRPRRPRR